MQRFRFVEQIILVLIPPSPAAFRKPTNTVSLSRFFLGWGGSFADVLFRLKIGGFACLSIFKYSLYESITTYSLAPKNLWQHAHWKSCNSVCRGFFLLCSLFKLWQRDFFVLIEKWPPSFSQIWTRKLHRPMKKIQMNLQMQPLTFQAPDKTAC